MKLINQSFLLEAAKTGQKVICIHRDDTGVFVLLALGESGRLVMESTDGALEWIIT